MNEENGSEIIQNEHMVAVLLPLVFNVPFDYRVPDGMKLSLGDYVRVPFGRKSLWGVVWGSPCGGVEEKKIKPIESVVAHLPSMSKHMRDFIQWVSWYTLSPLGMVLKLALSVPEAFRPPEKEVYYRLSKTHLLVKTSPSRARIIAYLSDTTARTLKEIKLHAKVSANVVREFLHAGGLDELFQHAIPERSSTFLAIQSEPNLSDAQSQAAKTLRNTFNTGFSVSVLDGVTGSGKTEVYFDTIAACIKAGKQALVLLPEIALSVQWFTRFQKRFGFTPAVWHSHVSAAKKRETWQAVTEGFTPVIVGARSALFLPFKSLSLIIVDEEHDHSYKQEEGVVYQARDMAVVRARHEKIPVILVSATPSLETEFNIEQHRYARIHLPARHGEAQMPQVRLIDMRTQSLMRQSWISQTLQEALIATVAQKNQAMLLMNRRGYAPLLLCRACGHRFQCPHCSAWLVLHKNHAKLMCHHCGHNVPIPRQCPDCNKQDTLIPLGPGVERVADEVRALLPDACVEVMTSDHIDSPAKANTLIRAMTEGKIDILIGTQMIAKGYHFAGLALVGVIDADMGLAGGDLRASERTYQLLHQLSGRAGREKIKGEVLLQTYLSEHPVMQALVSGDRDSFMALESRMREESLMPPYGKLAAIIVEGKNEREVQEFARKLVRSASMHEALGTGHTNPNVSSLIPQPLILGPAPAPISLLRGKFRYRILIKAERSFPLQAFLSDWLLTQKPSSSIRIKIDVEPYSFI